MHIIIAAIWLQVQVTSPMKTEQVKKVIQHKIWKKIILNGVIFRPWYQYSRLRVEVQIIDWLHLDQKIKEGHPLIISIDKLSAYHQRKREESCYHIWFFIFFLDNKRGYFIKNRRLQQQHDLGIGDVCPKKLQMHRPRKNSINPPFS